MKCAYCNNQDLVKKVFRVGAYNDVSYLHVCPVHWLACIDTNSTHWFREEAEALSFAVTRSLS